MSLHTKRGRPKGQRQRVLVVAGDVHLPPAILGWELDLLKPALGTLSTSKDTRPMKDGPRESPHAHQS
jgi:hypothetical protein